MKATNSGPYGCEEYMDRKWRKCFETGELVAALDWMCAGGTKRARRILAASGAVMCGTFSAGEIMYRQGAFDGQLTFLETKQ